MIDGSMKISNNLRVQILIILAAIALTSIPFPAGWVESYYSSGLYPHLSSIVKPLAASSPVALSDVFLVALVAGLPLWWTWRIRAAGVGKKWAAAGRAALATLTLAAFLICGFELLWGLNYQRVRLSAKLDWSANRVTPAAALALARTNILQLNAAAATAHAQEMPPAEKWRDDLEFSFRQVVAKVGGPADFRGVAPRRSLLAPLLAAEGCDGFINPFGYEVILDNETLSFEQPFLLAHEWAHLAGFADESEANFIGILACLRSDVPVIRYSGRLNLSFYLPRRSPNTNEPLPALSPRVANDIAAMHARVQKHYQPAVANLQSGIYNQFLKANHVQAGIRSYGQVAQLVVGTRFETNWTPVLRDSGEAPASRAIVGE
jgi:hypothetical protein